MTAGSQLFLVGMRGVGKTSAGRLAASRLHVPFLDSDEEIQRVSGKPVARIFREEGELAFRALERQVMLDLVHRRDVVVATGGGCVLDAAVRHALFQSRAAVWLMADIPALKQRVQGSERPSLTGADIEDEIQQILAAREPLYQQSCVQRVDTTRLTVEEVADVIQHLWKTLPDYHVR